MSYRFQNKQYFLLTCTSEIQKLLYTRVFLNMMHLNARTTLHYTRGPRLNLDDGRMIFRRWINYHAQTTDDMKTRKNIMRHKAVV